MLTYTIRLVVDVIIAFRERDLRGQAYRELANAFHNGLLGCSRYTDGEVYMYLTLGFLLKVLVTIAVRPGDYECRLSSGYCSVLAVRLLWRLAK